MVGDETIEGRCDVCGKSPRILTSIDSGQLICRFCMRELRGPRPDHLASVTELAHLRSRGIHSPDDLSKAECERLKLLIIARDNGHRVQDDISLDELLAFAHARANQQELSAIQHFFTKVVGVTRCNADGVCRQDIIGRCYCTEQVALEHEDDNPVDSNAVRVSNGDGQLGYLSADLAARVVADVMCGCRYVAFIKDVTGGTEDQPTRGVNLLIVKGPAGTSDKAMFDYVKLNPDLLGS